jgi:hypothetical protein
MTAVARLEVNGWPLLFADLLLSAPATQGSRISLPSVDVAYHSDMARAASSLHQKIAIIADNIVLGWAGKYSVASDVIGELKERCEHERFNLKRVEEYLRRQRRSVWNEIGLTGFVFDGAANKRGVFGCACRTVQSRVFGEIGLLGSGSALLEKYFQQDSSIPACSHDPENLAIRAVSYGMAAAANFLTMEQFACESLDNLFGGGYEIATQSYNKFVKLSDVLFAFWRATLDAGHKSVVLKAFPFFLLRYEYYEDLLIIRALALNENNGIANVHEKRFSVPPVYRYLSAEEKAAPPVPRFQSRWLCNYVQIFPEPNKMDILTFASYAPELAQMQFEERDGQLTRITVSQSVYSEIFSSIENRYSRREQL